jgi:hypothetical protein
MKNVTINLGESPHQWARVEAAKAGKSLSQWIAEHIYALPAPRNIQKEAMARFLATPDLPGITANLETREELYAERLFRRHERVSLREGPDDARKKGKGHRMDRGAVR